MMQVSKRIQDLPIAPSVAAGDYVLVSKGGVTVRTDVSALLSAGVTPITQLAALNDVDVSGKSGGSLLYYNSATGKWSPETFIDGGNF